MVTQDLSLDSKMSGSDGKPPLTIDRAAFLLLRVKRVFKMKAKARREKASAAQERLVPPGVGVVPACLAVPELMAPGDGGGRGGGGSVRPGAKVPPPLLRSRTLPSIVVPGINILQAQIDAKYQAKGGELGRKSSYPIKSSDSVSLLTSPGHRRSPDDVVGLHPGYPSALQSRGSTPEVTLSLLAKPSPSANTLSPSPRHMPLLGSWLDLRSSGASDKNSSGSSGGLSSRLVRFIGQGKDRMVNNNLNNNNDDQRRRLSWESGGDSFGRMKRSASIDSMVAMSSSRSPYMSDVPSAHPMMSLRLPSPLQPKGVAPVSPSIVKKFGAKGGDRTPSGAERKREGMELLAGLNLTKAERKRLEKLNKINIHLYALFAAVEHGQLEKVRTILDTTEVDVNNVNSDGFTTLDISVMMNHLQLTKLLMAYGAKEGSLARSRDGLSSHLSQLLKEAERRTEDLTSEVLRCAAAGSLTATQLKETERQLSLWDRRYKVLKKMRSGLDQLRPPDQPSWVAVEVIGPNAVKIKFREPDCQVESAAVKFKVQWSCSESFALLVGEKEISGEPRSELCVAQLTHGNKYYFRVAAGNLKGYGTFQVSQPSSVVPSSWRDVEGRRSRYAGRLPALDDLFRQVRSDIAAAMETPTNQRRNQKKISIKQLFAAAPKFHKTFKRGVYLACLLYAEDKILVTAEEFIPVVEVDETYPSSINTDFHWLMKVACTWDDVKGLKQDMEKSLSSSTVHFRIKLLQAAAHMQQTLGIQDLGQLYYKPLKDTNGTLLVSTVNYVRSPKSMSSLNVKWVPISRVQRRTCMTEEQTVGDMLVASVGDQILYHQTSSIPLARGLYLGYLKLKSSVDLIRVLVTEKTPNVLPHCKVRDNPHVSCEEWEWVRRMARRCRRSLSSDTMASEEGFESEDASEGNEDDEVQQTEVQSQFERQLSSASRRLFNLLDVNSDLALLHRLYDSEVIELTPEVSFIILIPPLDSVCTVPGQGELHLQRDGLIPLPVQVFETVHLATYQRELLCRYSRLSSILEMDTVLAQHNRREAFSPGEVEVANKRVSRLQELQGQVDHTWKGSRWLMDVLSFARDKAGGGMPVRILLQSDSDSGVLPVPGLSRKDLLRLAPKLAKSGFQKSSTAECLVAKGLIVGKGVGVEKVGGERPGSAFSATSLVFGEGEVTAPSGRTALLSQGPGERSKSDQQLQLPNSPHKRLVTSRSENQLDWSSGSVSVSRGGSSGVVGGGGGGGNSSIGGSMSSRADLADCDLPRKVSLPLPGFRSSTPPMMRRCQHSQSDSTISDRMNVGGGIGGGSESGENKGKEEEEGGNGSQDIQMGSRDSVRSSSSLPPPASERLRDNLMASGSCSDLASGVLQVYAAYETGLAQGTSVRLQVTSATTSREVVELVVKQLNMAVVLKGKEGPVYSQEQLKGFCLVAVIGARERCLRDDFRPLQLQNPWRQGRLYVRMRRDVLAALNHSSRQSAAAYL